MKKLSVDLEELERAMEDASGTADYYLNTETGEVILISEETRWKLEELFQDARGIKALPGQ